MKQKSKNQAAGLGVDKAKTGIDGLDEITGGGIPRGRPTLICGGAGSGKTLMAMEFLVAGATQFSEPGVFMSFEENEEELATNVESINFQLNKLVAQKKLLLEYVYVERSEIEETGEYDLEALFVRLDHAINSIGAKRVVLDTIEALFGGLNDHGVLRAELRRLFRWLKDKGVTAVITGERGDGTLTRHGLEEYVSDCVIALDHRVSDQISTRRLRVVKYRGTMHGTNEYPFLIDEGGISVLPSTSLKLNHAAPSTRVSTGIAKLDEMLDGKGYFKGSTVLVSGTAGTGKTSIAASFAEASSLRGEKTLYFCFEESKDQLFRNMRSIGIDLATQEKKKTLHIEANRPTLHGLEMHLVSMHKKISEIKPKVVVIDPLTNLISIGTDSEIKNMLTRLIDYLKSRQITALFTSLSDFNEVAESGAGISSLIDTWILVREIENRGERNRALYVLKSRGMPHSHRVREFVMNKKGIDLVDVYFAPEGVLVGSARINHEAHWKNHNESKKAALYPPYSKPLSDRKRRTTS